MIKQLTIPVTEQLPVKIIWKRGQRTIETKKRLMSDVAQTIVFDERFELSTNMEVNAEGRPTKPKMVSVILATVTIQMSSKLDTRVT